MISEYLLPAIKQRFPNAPFAFAKPPKPIASLRGPCDALGVLEIYDDGDEATVHFVGATHGHFGCYDDKLTETQKERGITSNVIEFLETLFADRVVIWRFLGGMAGGWRVLSPVELPPKPSMAKQQFLWSKEIK